MDDLPYNIRRCFQVAAGRTWREIMGDLPERLRVSHLMGNYCLPGAGDNVTSLSSIMGDLLMRRNLLKDRCHSNLAPRGEIRAMASSLLFVCKPLLPAREITSMRYFISH